MRVGGPRLLYTACHSVDSHKGCAHKRIYLEYVISPKHCEEQRRRTSASCLSTTTGEAERQEALRLEGWGGGGVDGWQQISRKGHMRQVRIGSHVPANNVRGMVQIICY